MFYSRYKRLLTFQRNSLRPNLTPFPRIAKLGYNFADNTVFIHGNRHGTVLTTEQRRVHGK